ncbi:MAG: acetyl ornithine aminotransferase family protein [Anaerolineales bacterium]|nr:acetyl ornithine aminotransferase family protein [Anaerolineales bacterium]
MQPMNVPGPKAKEIIERDSRVISPSYPRAYPFVMDHGKGSEVWDVDNNRFLDFAAGIAVVSTGHSHPKVVRVIQEQAEKFIHISCDFYHAPWVDLAEKFNQISPFEEEAVSFMTNSGTESVEAAIKLAKHVRGGSQFIGFLGGFHGRTLGSLSFTASKPHYHRGFYPLMNGVVHIPFPDPYRPLLESKFGEDYGETVVRYLDEQIFGKLLPPEDVSAILLEPILGEGGYVLPSPGFFPALRRLCDRYGILLIADEVQAGMGRTGKWWAIEQFGVEPDIICVGKGIASGIPLGAMIARKSLMTWPYGSHGTTYGGNPIASVAALATIGLIEDEFLQNAKEVGQYALQILEDMKERHPSVGDVRGIGLMIGVEFVKDRESKEPAKEIHNHISNLAFERGLLTLGCGESVIRISPPLSISRSEIEQGLSIFEEAISIAEREALLTYAS